MVDRGFCRACHRFSIAIADCCDTVLATCSNPNVQPSRMGTFTKVPGTTQNDHPVYTNVFGQYLFVESSAQWCVGPDSTSSSCGVKATSQNDACPSTASGWEAYIGGAWSTEYGGPFTIAFNCGEFACTPLPAVPHTAHACDRPGHPDGCWQCRTCRRSTVPLQ